MKRVKARTITLVLLVTVLLVVLVSIRIVYINDSAVRQSTEEYLSNEWVEYDGAFAGVAEECTDGYAIKVNRACIMTPREFLDKYSAKAFDLTEDIKGSYEDIQVKDADVPSVLVLNLSLRNTNNTLGYIGAIDWRAICEDNQSISMQPDWDLWYISDPRMKDLASFRLQTNSEYTTIVPFAIQAPQPYFDESSLRSRLPLEEGVYKFIFANLPSRKEVLVDTRCS